MSKIYEVLGGVINGDKRIKLFAAIGIGAVILIMLSAFIPTAVQNKKPEKSQDDYSEYVDALESETQELLSSISGAGRCKVMITLKNSTESVYAKNIEENNSSGSNSLKNEYVLYDGQEGETPVLIKQYYPDVQGVAIVCDGADNPAVRESIINTVSSLFSIPVNRISVSKYKG